jgi:hypothetical protein
MLKLGIGPVPSPGMTDTWLLCKSTQVRRVPGAATSLGASDYWSRVIAEAGQRPFHVGASDSRTKRSGAVLPARRSQRGHGFGPVIF